MRDDLFQEETERTKFFDFLIPVIPVINSTNSGEVMRNLLGMGEERKDDKEYPEHDVSQKFVTLVSPYIGDMRILISIVNEFWIYKKTIKESQDVSLNDENMLALMIYKNLCPKDFALLESEAGAVKEAFRYKAEACKKMQEKLNAEKTNLETEIIQLRQDIAKSIKEIKILILSELVGNRGVISEIKVSNNTFSHKQMLEDSFGFEKIRKGQLRVYYYPISTDYYSYRQDEVFTDVQDLTERMKELFTRYDRQLKFYNKPAEETKKEIEKLEKAIAALRAKTVQQLLESNAPEEVLPENVRANNLLMFMLRHGYINENYADYINYFHPGSITKEELNFILWIRDLVNQSMVSLKFTKAYIDRGINIEQFIRLLCHASPLIWTEFMYDEQLSLKKKNQYFKLIINACDVYDIENNNVGYEDEERGIYSEGVVKEYFEDQENILHELASVSWNKIKQVIDELGIRFKYVHDEFQEYVRVFIIGKESNTEEGKECPLHISLWMQRARLQQSLL